jgi:hypothetical protein
LTWDLRNRTRKQKSFRKQASGLPAATKGVPGLEYLENRCLLSWASSGPAPQLNPANPLGAATGRISALAMTTVGLPAAPTLLVGSAGGGVWSTVSFRTASPYYKPLTDGFPLLDPTTGLGTGLNTVGSIAVDPNNPSTIYVGTGEANGVLNGNNDTEYGSGILKSTDGGATFQVLATGSTANSTAFFRHSISKILVDPTNSNRLYAAVVASGWNSDQTTLTTNGIYRSIDGGQSWSLITGPGAGQIGSNITVTDLDYTLNPASLTPLTLFAGVADAKGGTNGIYTSTDGGNSWAPIVSAILPPSWNTSRIFLAANHTNPAGIVYAFFSQAGGKASGLYASANNGATWTNTFCFVGCSLRGPGFPGAGVEI